MRTYKMLNLRTLFHISVISTINSLIHLCVDLNLSQCNTHTILFDLYDKSFQMDFEDSNEVCKIPQWGIHSEPRKSDCIEFLSRITIGETRTITQATIGSIHFPALHYFALFVGRCINGKHDHSHLCASNLSILKSVVMNDKQFHLGLSLRVNYIIILKMGISLVEFTPPA